MGKYTFVDLFAGCGGLSDGFMQSGAYDGIAHVEWELPMVKSLRNRLVQKYGYSKQDAERKVVHFDIQNHHELVHGNWTIPTRKKYEKTNHRDIIEFGLRGIEAKSVDLVIGGPPCQAYSIAGRAQDPNSMQNDYRNFLFESFMEVVSETKPKLFVFENVPGMLSAKPGGIAITKRIHEAFSTLGYEILPPEQFSKAVFDTSDYGVPQARRRVIILGKRRDVTIELGEIYDRLRKAKNSVDKRRTVRDAISDLSELLPLATPFKEGNRNVSHTFSDITTDHIPRFHNKRDQTIFRNWITEKANKWPTKEKLNFYTQQTGRISNHNKYRNLEWDSPSPTIVAHLAKDGLMFIHPDEKQARTITVREAARLQGFSDDFEFIGSMASKFRMIGNAVPPPFAKCIASVCTEILKQIDNEKKVECSSGV